MMRRLFGIVILCLGLAGICQILSAEPLFNGSRTSYVSSPFSPSDSYSSVGASPMSVAVPMSGISKSSSSMQFRTKASEVQGGVTTYNRAMAMSNDLGDDDGGGDAAEEDTEITPVGDPILPLLLMLLGYAAWKWRQSKRENAEI